MAYPLEAYYGRNTFALLARCVFCGRPYDESGDWTTVKGECKHGRPGDVWMIVCDPCFEKMKEEEE